MLGKELLSGLECALTAIATAVSSHNRSCFTSCFTVLRFSPLRPGVVGVCFDARAYVMPERLLSVISGILAGGIPGFRFELCCFSPSYLALFCVSLFSLFCLSSVASLNDTQVVIMHVGSIAGCTPTLLFLFDLFWLLFCGFLFLMGLLTGLCIGPLPALLRLPTYLTALHANLQFSSFAAVERV